MRHSADKKHVSAGRSSLAAVLAAIALLPTGAACAQDGDNRPPLDVPDRVLQAATFAGTGDFCLAVDVNGRIGLWRAGQNLDWRDVGMPVRAIAGFLPATAHFAVVGNARNVHEMLFYSAVAAKRGGTVEIPFDARVTDINSNWFVAIRPLNRDRLEEPIKMTRFAGFWHREMDRWIAAFEWNAPANESVRVVRLIDAATAVLFLTHSGMETMAPVARGELVVLDLASKKVVRRRPVETRPSVDNLFLSENCEFVAVASRSLIEVYSTKNLEPCGRLKPDAYGDLPRVSISADGRYIAYGSDRLEVTDLPTRQIRVIDPLNGKLVQSELKLSLLSGVSTIEEEPAANDPWLRFNLCLAEVRFVDNGRKLAAVTRSGTLRIWDAQNWKLLVDKQIVESRVLRAIIEQGNRLVGGAAKDK